VWSELMKVCFLTEKKVFRPGARNDAAFERQNNNGILPCLESLRSIL